LLLAILNSDNEKTKTDSNTPVHQQHTCAKSHERRQLREESHYTHVCDRKSDSYQRRPFSGSAIISFAKEILFESLLCA
jgi:hypothetical protein